MVANPSAGEQRRKADRAIEDVGLPSRQRYNIFVNQAVEMTKLGSDHPQHAIVFAVLALAEATFLLEHG
jgi:replication-associated recombination protein RarA